MVIVDNSDAGYSVIQGTFLNSTATPYWSDNNGNDAAHYTFANGTGNANQATAVAQFTPNLPATGYYPVYTWYNTATNRNTSAAYTINYAGGSFTVHVNQQLTGNGWIYLGTYYFNAGTSGNVQISNASSSTGQVIADAVRFGNGRALAYDSTKRLQSVTAAPQPSPPTQPSAPTPSPSKISPGFIGLTLRADGPPPTRASPPARSTRARLPMTTRSTSARPIAGRRT